MVIDQIDIANMAIVKPKHDTPVRSNGDAPETLEPAFKWMELEAGKIHIRRNSGAAKNREEVLNLLDHVGLEPSSFAVDKKPLQSLVSKILDHAYGAGPVPSYATVISDAFQSRLAIVSTSLRGSPYGQMGAMISACPE
jgi:hypothetical protein